MSNEFQPAVLRTPIRTAILGALVAATMTLVGCGTSTSTSAPTVANTGQATTSTGTPAASAALTCPAAAEIGTAAGTTYTGPESTPGGNPGTVVCTYAANGTTALLVSLYPSGTSLQSITAIVPAPTTPISGLGDSAAYYGTEVYVSNTSSATFSVIDQSGDLTLAQVEAVAHAVLGS